ncbi:MAG: hypothetical protein IJT18_05810 [Oscillospiraceae bacterium]|nr:hypothetical protein [Oscillospiraceae bacterium]
MSELQKFRSAIGGFHRGDVAEYIERTALAHREALAEAEAKQKAAEAETAAAFAERDALRAVLEKLTAAYDEAKAALERDPE